MGGGYDYIFKVLIVGDSGVGKSSLMLRFADDTFTESHITTIGVDFKIRELMLEDKSCRIQIWDTAGQERFKTITTQYYRGSDGVIFVFDTSNMESFLNVNRWVHEADRYGREGLCRILVGNKSDLDKKRVVNYESGQELADKLGVPYLETSAKNSENVYKAFVSLCADMKSLTGCDDLKKSDDESSVKLGDSTSVKKEVVNSGLCNC